MLVDDRGDSGSGDARFNFLCTLSNSWVDLDRQRGHFRGTIIERVTVACLPC